MYTECHIIQKFQQRLQDKKEIEGLKCQKNIPHNFSYGNKLPLLSCGPFSFVMWAH